MALNRISDTYVITEKPPRICEYRWNIVWIWKHEDEDGVDLFWLHHHHLLFLFFFFFNKNEIGFKEAKELWENSWMYYLRGLRLLRMLKEVVVMEVADRVAHRWDQWMRQYGKEQLVARSDYRCFKEDAIFGRGTIDWKLHSEARRNLISRQCLIHTWCERKK